MNKHAMMVIMDGDKMLFVKRSMDKKTLPGIWAYPSGTIEDGESAVTTAIREAKEELNLNVISTKQSSSSIIELKEFNVELVTIICQVDNLHEMKTDKTEIEIAEFMTLDEFFDRFKDEEIGHGLRIIRKDRSLLLGGGKMSEFNLSSWIYKPGDWPGDNIPASKVKEFIKKDWFLTNLEITHILRKCNIDEDFIFEELKELKRKKDKLAGDKLTK